MKKLVGVIFVILFSFGFSELNALGACTAQEQDNMVYTMFECPTPSEYYSRCKEEWNQCCDSRETEGCPTME